MNKVKEERKGRGHNASTLPRSLMRRFLLPFEEVLAPSVSDSPPILAVDENVFLVGVH